MSEKFQVNSYNKVDKCTISWYNKNAVEYKANKMPKKGVHNMYEIKISKDFFQMIDAMAETEVKPSQIMSELKEHTPPIAENFGLEKVAVEINIPHDMIQSEVKKHLQLFDSERNGIYKFEQKHDIRGGGTIKILGESNLSEAKEKFELYAKIAYVMFDRLLESQLLDRALVTDNLTGAKNIYGLRKFVDELKDTGNISDYAAFFANITNFKYVNQKLGMQNGDNILRSLAQRFDEEFAGEGDIFRLGSDNFIMLVKRGQAEKLTEMLKSYYVTLDSGESVHIHFKAGIYYADSDSGIKELINYSTAAYSSAKVSGRDLVQFEPEMIEDELRTESILEAFPDALENHELKVFYQPKVRSDDLKLVGCEALCRWIKNGKIVPPMEFIPVLERYGNIAQLDLYVIEEVCRDIRGWLDAGIEPVRTSVNISRRDMALPDLAKCICEIIDKYQIDHKYIEIELTETYGSEEMSKMVKLIDDLKNYGFKISIDDFGSGYSTLTMLKSINADIIKLDRAFIKDLSSSSVSDRIIMRNVVNMVRDLSKEVIAEGTETKEQVGFLSSIGCDVIQGYYYDPPLPKEKFNERLTNDKFYSTREQTKK